MKRFLLVLLAIVTMVVGGALAGAGELPDLPQDSHAEYLTLVGTPGEARFESLKVAFEKHPGLKSVAERTHFTVLADTSTLYRTRYSSEFGRLPTVRLQEADGDVVFESSGRDLVSADSLYAQLEACCGRGSCDCPKCHPHRQPSRPIDVTPAKQEPAPPLPPRKAPRAFGKTWQLIAMCSGAAVVGFALGVWRIVAPEWAER